MAILRRYNNNRVNSYNYGNIQVDFDRREVHFDGHNVYLTPTEFKILEFLIHMKNKVLTKEMLVEHLYEKDADYIDEHALAVYISRLRNKIGDSGNDYIKTIYGMGYMWIDERG